MSEGIIKKLDFEWEETSPGVWSADIPELTAFLRVSPVKDGYICTLNVNTFHLQHFGGHSLQLREPGRITGVAPQNIEAAKNLAENLVGHWCGFVRSTYERVYNAKL